MRHSCIRFLAGVSLALQFAVCCFGGQQTAVEWLFSRPGDLQGWASNGDLAEVVVTNGALSCRSVGSDPILEYRLSMNLAATPWQVVEIRMRADSDGAAELFWSNISTGRYGGFSQEKTTRFLVRGDRQWHTYRLLPFWHREGKIARLRFDVYDGARFDLASIRVLNLSSESVSEKTEFELGRSLEGWKWVEPLDGSVAEPGGAGGRIDRCGAGLLLGPPVRIPSSQNSFVSIRMTVDRGHHGTIFFATDQGNGLQKQTFRLEADGREHTYNVDMLQASGWGGTVVAVGVQPSNETNAVAMLSRLAIGSHPEGPPRLRVAYFALQEALPRAGLPAVLSAMVLNDGAEVVTNLHADIVLPSGMEVVGGLGATQSVPRLGFDEEKILNWRVQSRAPIAGQVRLKLTAPNADPVEVTAPFRFTQRVDIKNTGYVPEPKPVRGPYEVGVYYFPGWNTASQWEPLRRFPERRPVLGWYREGDPEVADWHIKWAVEHGITFFAYDWYWSKGSRHLEHALHDGYFKARYRSLLKFCLLWANHNPPGSSSLEDCRAVARYWIDNYFRRPEHLQFDGKPVMIIFAPDRFTQDLGSEGTKKAIEAMRAECTSAGLKGLYLVACVGDAGGMRRAMEEGYDSVTAYNWPSLGMTGEGMYAPFEALVPAYRQHWEHLLGQNQLPLVPLPVCGGWDSRPWHGENNLVRFGRTPELFKKHLTDARRLLESGSVKAGTPKAILVEAWNEWGEGSYIEPHAEFGFGYLDAVRETFTSATTRHVDTVPGDVGLGPYDVVPAKTEQTVWDFTEAESVWNNTMDLGGVTVVGGILNARTTGNDPAFFGPGIRVSASDFRTVAVRMRLSRAQEPGGQDTAQLFWRTTRLPESESTSIRFPVEVDGQWHEYRVAVAANPRWRGTVTRLRLDPANRADIEVQIDRIALER